MRMTWQVVVRKSRENTKNQKKADYRVATIWTQLLIYRTGINDKSGHRAERAEI